MLAEEIAVAFQSVIDEAQTMTFLARASELQEAAVRKIDRLLPRVAGEKEMHIRASDEVGANAALAMELSLCAVQAELRMWLKLKSEDPEGAWDDLVIAQGYLEGAAAVRRQIGLDSSGLENLRQKLFFVERWIFPPQVFNSIGGTVRYRECSVCGGDYESCDHIKGRAYMGRMCHTIVLEFERLSEISIVTNPADKRCRVTHFSDQGKMRNKMTWRLEERRDPPHGETGRTSRNPSAS